MIVPLRMLILAVVDAVIHDIGAEHSEHCSAPEQQSGALAR